MILNRWAKFLPYFIILKHIITSKMHKLLSTLVLIAFSQVVFAQAFTQQIDSLLATQKQKKFNGIILITKGEKSQYLKVQGYSNLAQKTPLNLDDQFVIGSISKQITAVLVLQAYEKGQIELNVPIRKYLTDWKQTWLDSVTVHQLLTHTHGIVAYEQPLEFVPGSKFVYSQIGYEILSKILESVTQKSFARLSNSLFKRYKMIHTFHPDLHKHQHLVTGYTELKDGTLNIEKASFQNYVAAGSFISTANDLLLWNKALYGGKLLLPKTMELMTTRQKNATREHPMFGTTDYGYGITVDNRDGILQYGTTGFAPGFCSMNFYYPATKTSIIILENITYNVNDLKKTFATQLGVWKMVRNKIND